MAFHYLLSEHHILRNARDKLKLTQQQVANKAGITLRQYQKFESGERKLTSSSFNIARNVLETLKLDLTAFNRGDYNISEEEVPDSAELEAAVAEYLSNKAENRS